MIKEGHYYIHTNYIRAPMGMGIYQVLKIVRHDSMRTDVKLKIIKCMDKEAIGQIMIGDYLPFLQTNCKPISLLTLTLLYE